MFTAVIASGAHLAVRGYRRFFSTAPGVETELASTFVGSGNVEHFDLRADTVVYSDDTATHSPAFDRIRYTGPVAAFGAYIAIGQPNEPECGDTDRSGCVRVFKQTPTGIREIDRIVPNIVARDGEFGSSVHFGPCGSLWIAGAREWGKYVNRNDVFYADWYRPVGGKLFGDILVNDVAMFDVSGSRLGHIEAVCRVGEGYAVWDGKAVYVGSDVIRSDLPGFGASLAYAGGVLAVGAPEANAVVLYTKGSGGWEDQVTLRPESSGVWSGFGTQCIFRDGKLGVLSPDLDEKGAIFIYKIRVV